MAFPGSFYPQDSERGCAIALVDENAASDLIESINNRYYGARNLASAVFITTASEGAHEIRSKS